MAAWRVFCESMQMTTVRRVYTVSITGLMASCVVTSQHRHVTTDVWSPVLSASVATNGISALLHGRARVMAVMVAICGQPWQRCWQ